MNAENKGIMELPQKCMHGPGLKMQKEAAFTLTKKQMLVQRFVSTLQIVMVDNFNNNLIQHH